MAIRLLRARRPKARVPNPYPFCGQERNLHLNADQGYWLGACLHPRPDAEHIHRNAEQVRRDKPHLPGSQSDHANNRAIHARNSEPSPTLATDQNCRKNCKTARQIIQPEHSGPPAPGDSIEEILLLCLNSAVFTVTNRTSTVSKVLSYTRRRWSGRGRSSSTQAVACVARSR